MVRSLLTLALALLLAAPAAAEVRVQKRDVYAQPPSETIIYVLPFLTVMVPDEVATPLFDRFVDELNSWGASLPGASYEFVILKGGREEIPPEWLAGNTYLTGEIYGYVEDSGCCATDITLNNRIQLFQPHSDAPTLVLQNPAERFFGHDRSSLSVERGKLANQVGSELATRLLQELVGA